MTSFFRSYDLRGIYPDEIGLDQAKRVGKALGTVINTTPVLVGRDGRTHGETVMDAFVDGVTSTGTNVLDVGQVPTPLVRFGCFSRDIDAGVAITASHNPPEYTGFKFSIENGRAMTREGGMAEIQEHYETGSFNTGSGTCEKIDLVEEYIEYVRERIHGDLDLTVVANFGNGVGGPVARELFEALGCTVTGINETIDGSFPDHPPNPMNETATNRVLDQMENADLGLAFDGDADRVGIVLPGYGTVSPDELLALYAEVSLEEQQGTVIYSLNTSKLLPEIVRSHGGEPQEVRVGFTYISQCIHDNPDVVFAGEPSGHFAFPVFGVPWDDGIFTAALTAQLVASNAVQDRVAGYPNYPVSPELRIDCPEALKDDVVTGVAEEYDDYEQTTVDGVKVFFEDGWALVRPSNTEPKLSVRCEADTQRALDRIRTDVTDTIDRLLEELSG